MCELDKVEYAATDVTSVELGQWPDESQVRDTREAAEADFVGDGDDVLLTRQTSGWSVMTEHMPQGKTKVEEAWDDGHLLGEALAYNAFLALLHEKYGIVVSKSDYARYRSERLQVVPHWGLNPHAPSADS